MARKKQVVLSGKGPALSVVRKPSKLLWMHEQDGRPGFWLDDLAALQAFTNHVLEQGIEQGRRAERAAVVAFLDKRVDWHWDQSNGGKDLIHQSRGAGVEFAQMDIEAGRHINAAKTDESKNG
jgi:hypothetical protein